MTSAVRRTVRWIISILAIGVLIVPLPSPALADSIRSHEWILHALDIARANKISTGDGVIVAVIDTGVDPTHPDLEGNVLRGIDFNVQGKLAGKGNGFGDVDGHGTGMASIIAGHGHGPNEASGIHGVAPEARILPVRDTVGLRIDLGALANSINWAVAHGATVISISQGGSGGSAAVAKAVADAEARNVVVVASAGNTPLLKTVGYPAAYSGVVAVAGVGEDGKHASISVTGPQVVLSAPAVDIYNAYLDHGYAHGTGTSPAAAIVAGAAALVRAKYPKLSAVEVIHRLTATATDEGPPGRDDTYGYGDLNLIAALTANVPPLTSTSSPKPDRTSPSPDPVATAQPTTDHTPWLPIVGIVIVLIAGAAIWASRGHRT